MRKLCFPSVFLTMAMTFFVVASANAQTSIALSAYGAFNGTTTGNGTIQSPSNSAGGLLEIRHISNPILGFEATYSFNRANQNYSADTASIVCPGGTIPCYGSPQSIRANAHEVTADWTPSIGIADFRPFGVLGIGALFDVPVSGQSGSTTTKAVYVYGAGVDWGLLPHFGLRFQYRGNLYKAPDLSSLYTSTDKFTSTAEPMIGIYFRL
jgi:opacity protein-like surface antigen